MGLSFWFDHYFARIVWTYPIFLCCNCSEANIHLPYYYLHDIQPWTFQMGPCSYDGKMLQVSFQLGYLAVHKPPRESFVAWWKLPHVPHPAFPAWLSLEWGGVVRGNGASTARSCNMKSWLVVCFFVFGILPYIGDNHPNCQLTNIFQRVWNHQPELYFGVS